jgi:hypothetical protein
MTAQRKEMAAQREALQHGLTVQRDEFRVEMTAQREGLRTEMAALRVDLQQLQVEVTRIGTILRNVGWLFGIGVPAAIGLATFLAQVL